MLRLVDLTLAVAGVPILDRAELHVPDGRKIGLVGRNGAGKTTLLRMIAGALTPDGGEMRLRPDASIGVVAQDAPGGDTTPLEAVLAADVERAALLAERESAPPERQGEIEARLIDIRAAAAPARAATILEGLGFDEQARSRPLSSFSGGWRMRAALAAVLFVEPDLLLLDEPTNHLDLEATMWLEAHLARYPGALIVVSHDRELLNRVPDAIVHLGHRKLTTYMGGYDAFERVREQKKALAEKQREKTEAARAKMQAFVDRFRYKASKARQAQSRLKMIEKLGPPSAAAREPEIRFAFPNSESPAPPMVAMDRASVGYGASPILRRLNLRLDPDDRIAFLGANGNGKSTLAKLIAGDLEPMEGEVTRARHLRVAFFAQHQIEDLSPGENAIEHLHARLPKAREEELRARAAAFGLVQDKAERPAAKLSGGEKTRLSFALMSICDPQLLILDEPTNHLDIESREALVQAINGFSGAVILISHDSRLIELTADRLWLVEGGRVRSWDGDVADYREAVRSARADAERARKREKQAAKPAKSQGLKAKAAERRQRLAPLRKAAREAELAVERLTADKEAIDRALADPASFADGGGADLMKRSAELADAIEAAEARWLEAEEAVEDAAKGDVE